MIDDELDSIAAVHLAKVGPAGETPAELALRIAGERERYAWFKDRPPTLSHETDLTDRDLLELSNARARVGHLIDHLGGQWPAPEDLPSAQTVTRWHTSLVSASKQQHIAKAGPATSLAITSDVADAANDLAQCLELLAGVSENVHLAKWIDSSCRSAITGEQNPWLERLQERINEAGELSSTHAELLRRPVELPPGLLRSQDARAALSRAAAGKKLWSVTMFGKAEAKALTSAIRLDGNPVDERDRNSWIHIAAVVTHRTHQAQANARWDALAEEIGAPYGPQRQAAIDYCRAVLRICQRMNEQGELLANLTGHQFSGEMLYLNPSVGRALAQQIEAVAAAARLSTADAGRRCTAELFVGRDRSSVAIRKFLVQTIGRSSITTEQISDSWVKVTRLLKTLKTRALDFDIIASTTQRISQAGAAAWAATLRRTQAAEGEAALIAHWRKFWDHAAAEALLSRIDRREDLAKLLDQRSSLEAQSRRLFGELVRERTFYQLQRGLTDSIKAALVEFVRALTRIGKGTGKSAWMHRRTARDAMSRCYNAVPCWIMPTWRVAEQLPAKLGAVDLVILDEASQSDITELPALLRGKKILIVGDDRQVSPMPPFVTQEKIEQLIHHYLGSLPFKSLLQPGDSIYDLMRAVFPNDRLMLKEHFRCVEPIIRFSMQFYSEELVPLRVPTASERLDPPLVDIYVPHGERAKRRKINQAEAEVIVSEVAKIVGDPSMRSRSIGIISLIGAEQANFIRIKLAEEIGEELIQRHSILCGDSATFQGTERDIVFLSMVADPAHKTALTALRYEQRFNVAVSRARDRIVLVRSIKREGLNPADLKAKLIAHFENPMPTDNIDGNDALETCESLFEREMMSELLKRGYRVSPQVGSLGFRIDMVVEGEGGRRLAVECDGDTFHGPEQWRRDMSRQRVLERVGWRFWRCFASSFYRDRQGVIGDLVSVLSTLGIEPTPSGETASTHTAWRYVEHKVVTDPKAVNGGIDASVPPKGSEGTEIDTPGVSQGDRVIICYSESGRRLSFELTDDSTDLEKGKVSVTSPLGQAVLGAEEGEEIEFLLDDGACRRALIELVERVPTHKISEQAPAQEHSLI